MIKIFFALLIGMGLLGACGKSSSPEGRMSMKIDVISNRIDSLTKQNSAILDSLGVIKKELASRP